MDQLGITRRQILIALAGVAVCSVFSRPSASQLLTTSQRPDPKKFETGDIVWPKPPGAFVPYAGTATDKTLVDAQEVQEDVWNNLRVEFIRSARADTPGVDPAMRIYQRRV